MKRPVLYPYQKEYFSTVINGFGGYQNQLMVLPTGGGKTTVFGSLIDHWYNENKKCIVIVHRVELVDQVVETLARFGIQCGIIAGGYPRDYAKQVQVGMIQSIPQNIPIKFDYIVIDECHHCVSSTYQKLWGIFPEAQRLGVTATPIRTDGLGFNDHFQTMIDLYSLPWLIENGYLVKPKHYFCCELKEIRVQDGDYDFTEMSKIMRSERHISDVIESYQKYCPGRRAVVFAVDVAHSKILVERFLAVGIRAEHIDGELDPKERKAIIKRFKTGVTTVLCNFNIISEGFDVPAIEAVILAKRSKSLSWYLQSIGRALRLDNANGKKFGYVLDCASAYLDHGFAGIAYQWSLEGSKELIEDSIVKSKLFIKKEKGGIEPVVTPEEIKGVEMVALTDELEAKCANLEMAIYKAQQDFLPVEEGILYYNDMLTLAGSNWTQVEINYCIRRTGISPETLRELLAA